MSEWLLFNAKWAICQPYHDEYTLHFYEMIMMSPLYKTGMLSWICIVLAHWNNIPYIIMTPSQPVFALTSYCCVLIGDATNTNFIVIDLTQPGLEPTNYHTRGENTTNYTTDAVKPN